MASKEPESARTARAAALRVKRAARNGTGTRLAPAECHALALTLLEGVDVYEPTCGQE